MKYFKIYRYFRYFGAGRAFSTALLDISEKRVFFRRIPDKGPL
jgi:hypothetical protein